MYGGSGRAGKRDGDRNRDGDVIEDSEEKEKEEQAGEGQEEHGGKGQTKRGRYRETFYSPSRPSCSTWRHEARRRADEEG